MARELNEGLLPPRYFAEAQVTGGSRVEIDVATFEEKNGGPFPAAGGVAVWAPPRSTAVTPLSFTDPGLFEVQVLHEEGGPRVVAAVELVSPANKDRPANRRAFAVKRGSYLQQGISVVLVDVVTERPGNLHGELLGVLQVPGEPAARSPGDLYAAAYRTFSRAGALSLEMWVESLALAAPLPILPLWLGPELSIPLNLEQTYAAACVARRIP